MARLMDKVAATPRLSIVTRETVEIEFVGSRVLTSTKTRADTCFSKWCPYQLWTFKPAKFIGG
ncbi:MAG: hypothetical protein HY906_06960 [Deltaproteobacteria bacterium]|nr:hypothetical protein [Deltaproteobacteria bacterium]